MRNYAKNSLSVHGVRCAIIIRVQLVVWNVVNLLISHRYPTAAQCDKEQTIVTFVNQSSSPQSIFQLSVCVRCGPFAYYPGCTSGLLHYQLAFWIMSNISSLQAALTSVYTQCCGRSVQTQCVSPHPLHFGFCGWPVEAIPLEKGEFLLTLLYPFEL